MKIACVGAGPGGLFLAILLKQSDPRHDITVYERNPADATFGFGVVFSDRTLDTLAAADAWTHEALTGNSIHWEDIEIRHRGRVLRATGNGFSAISRMRLLELLQERAIALGVDIRFEQELADPDAVPAADLIVAADGVNSRIRERFADTFRPRIDIGPAKFIWFGTTQRFGALTFDFVETEHGRFGLHAYPYDDAHGTFLVECDEATWRNAGLDAHETDPLPPGETDQHAMAHCERVFADCLDGHRLIGNASTWRNFPTVRNARWHHGNIVLIGDAAHTAHFSVGSGTKMAMEDAMALSAALARFDDLAGALTAYEAEQRPRVEHIQGAAEPSRHWWEHFGRRMDLAPEPFAFHFLTRTGLAGHAAVRSRAAGLVRSVDRWYAETVGADARTEPISTPLTLGELTVPNRLAVPVPFDEPETMAGAARWGAGLVVPGPVASGPWQPARIEAWRAATDDVVGQTTARCALWIECGDDGENAGVVDDATLCHAADAGFAMVLLDIGPATDPDRAVSLVDAARQAWNAGPLGVILRQPGTEPVTRRADRARAITVAAGLKQAGCGLIGIAPAGIAGWPGERPAAEQFMLADVVRNEVDIPTMLVGGIRDTDDANTQILAHRTDICMGRPLLGTSRWRPPAGTTGDAG